MNKTNIPPMPWILRPMLERYKDKLIDADTKAGTYTPEISGLVDHLDSVLEIVDSRHTEANIEVING